jgi:hypothetical protein
MNSISVGLLEHENDDLHEQLDELVDVADQEIQQLQGQVR